MLTVFPIKWILFKLILQKHYIYITKILQKIQLDYILSKAIDFLSKKDKIKISVIILIERGGKDAKLFRIVYWR